VSLLLKGEWRMKDLNWQEVPVLQEVQVLLEHQEVQIVQDLQVVLESLEHQVVVDDD